MNVAYCGCNIFSFRNKYISIHNTSSPRAQSRCSVNCDIVALGSQVAGDTVGTPGQVGLGTMSLPTKQSSAV